MTYWSLHTHSRYSQKDGMSDIKGMVKRAAELGYPALGLTDHGTMAGAVQHYQQCTKAGVKPLPGVELYFTGDSSLKEGRSMHLTVAAFTEQGYRNLVKVTTTAHERFYRRPRLDVADLAELHAGGHLKGLLVATGCRSGPVVRTLVERESVTQATRIATGIARYFDRSYIEIMNHGFEADGASDDEICEALMEIARTTGIPPIITGDSHYVLPADQERHNTMKEMLTFADQPEDGHFHGCGYHLVDEQWLKSYLEPDMVAAGMESLRELAEAASVRIPELDKFVLKVPDVTYGGDPDDELGERVINAMRAAGLEDEEHCARLFAELDVIRDVGMAGYLLLVASITDHMAEIGIWYQTRGSASGSFACYLLGITQVDPCPSAWDIRMDRFLSGDRTSPPDIDLDIQSDRREEIVAWVGDRFAIKPVSVYARYSLDENTAEQTGSLRVEYWSTQRKRGMRVANDAVIPAKDWDMLVDLVQYQLIKNTGKNAAGYIVADTEADLETLPLVRIGSGDTLVTAFDKDDVEAFGFPKVDLLGLKMLYAMQIACTLIDPLSPREFWHTIPIDDPSALDRAGSGNTKGMFQLEGWAQTTGLEELDPKVTSDIIAAQALFRPGVSKEFLGTYMRRRHGREQMPQVHADITTELASTYGVAIFQEQVVGVLRTIGMEPVELTAMLKAVKASGKAGLVKAKEAVAEALPAIIALAKARGWSDDDITWLEAALTDYGAGYSFNKGHSTVYGLFAYNTAWLATHEPLAFWTGVLIAYTGHKDQKKRDVELLYVKAARDNGLSVQGPHVNKSRIDYTPDPEHNVIRKGLVSVSGVGRRAAGELIAKAPFSSLVDLGQRCQASLVSGARDLALGKPPGELGTGTVIRALYEAKALTGLDPTHEPAAADLDRGDQQQALLPPGDNSGDPAPA